MPSANANVGDAVLVEPRRELAEHRQRIAGAVQLDDEVLPHRRPVHLIGRHVGGEFDDFAAAAQQVGPVDVDGFVAVAVAEHIGVEAVAGIAAGQIMIAAVGAGIEHVGIIGAEDDAGIGGFLLRHDLLQHLVPGVGGPVGELEALDDVERDGAGIEPELAVDHHGRAVGQRDDEIARVAGERERDVLLGDVGAELDDIVGAVGERIGDVVLDGVVAVAEIEDVGLVAVAARQVMHARARDRARRCSRRSRRWRPAARWPARPSRR